MPVFGKVSFTSVPWETILSRSQKTQLHETFVSHFHIHRSYIIKMSPLNLKKHMFLLAESVWAWCSFCGKPWAVLYWVWHVLPFCDLAYGMPAVLMKFTGRHADPTRRVNCSHLSWLRSFSTWALQWWNDLPIPKRTAPSLPSGGKISPSP